LRPSSRAKRGDPAIELIADRVRDADNIRWGARLAYKPASRSLDRHASLAMTAAASALLARRRRPIGVAYPAAAAPSFSKEFQAFPRKFQGNSKLFQSFPRISKLFSLAVSREIKGLSASRAGIAFFQFLRRRRGAVRPGDRPSNALAIQDSAKSDYRKEIVGGEIVEGDFAEGPRGERGVACAKGAADRPDVGAAQVRRLDV
jgi:hypothetical protein